MKIDVLLGLQWGDEGKGKIVDYLSPKYDIIARFQGGPNAGHTLKIGDNKHVLHIIPSGIFHKDKINLIGNGVIIDPSIIRKELNAIIDKGFDPKQNLLISNKAHLILPTHRFLDAANEQYLGNNKIGSTLKGIGPCYTDKIARFGIRLGDIFNNDFKNKYDNLKKSHIDTIKAKNFNIEDYKIDGKNLEELEKDWFESIEFIKSYKIIDSEIFLNKALKEGKKILAEGAQGSLLDVEFGTYPFVTSSNTITGGVCIGLGVPPTAIGRVFGVFKAYCTRVGSGPFPTELFDEIAKKMQKIGNEFGATTGRTRRCGWLDLPALKYSIMINGVTDLIMMKVDVLNDFDKIKIGTGYLINGKEEENFTLKIFEDNLTVKYQVLEGWKQDINKENTISELPKALKEYIKFIENEVEVPVNAISVGPERNETIWNL